MVILVARMEGCAMGAASQRFRQALFAGMAGGGQILRYFTAAPQSLPLGLPRGTEAIRQAIQNRQESLRALAKRYGINQKTVATWKNRAAISDLPTGPRESKSTSLSLEDEAIIVALRRHTLLPLDDCLYALRAMIPHQIAFPVD
jgi:transposase-like protein